MKIDWTIVISSAVTASIISLFQWLALRYFARAVERIEKRFHNGKGGGGPG